MIRKIVAADIDAALRVFDAACRASHPFLSEEFIRKSAECMRSRTLIGYYTDVLDDGGIRAFLTRNDSFIDALFVDPAFQSRGLGKMLLDHVKSTEKMISLSVFAKNPRAIKFYQREAFWAVGMGTHRVTGEPIVFLEWKEGGRPSFDFEELREEHLPVLHEWLRRPHVAEWWDNDESLDALRKHFLGGPGKPPTVRGYIAHVDSRPIGFIQSYVAMEAGDGWWPDETDPGVVGIDQFLAEEADLGKHIGRGMIRAFVDRLFTDPSVTAVQTDPTPANVRAIRCYRRAGFAEIGLIRTPDGPAMLMRTKRG